MLFELRTNSFNRLAIVIEADGSTSSTIVVSARMFIVWLEKIFNHWKKISLTAVYLFFHLLIISFFLFISILTICRIWSRREKKNLTRLSAIQSHPSIIFFSFSSRVINKQQLTSAVYSCLSFCRYYWKLRFENIVFFDFVFRVLSICRSKSTTCVCFVLFSLVYTYIHTISLSLFLCSSFLSLSLYLCHAVATFSSANCFRMSHSSLPSSQYWPHQARTKTSPGVHHPSARAWIQPDQLVIKIPIIIHPWTHLLIPEVNPSKIPPLLQQRTIPND